VIFEKAVRSFLLVGMSVNFLGFSRCKPFNLLSSFFRERLTAYSIKVRVLTPKGKNPTPEGPALETPGRGYNALTPEGARLSCP